MAQQLPAYATLTFGFLWTILSQYYALVCVDAYSRYPDVCFTKDTTASFLIRYLRKFFSREGIPQVVVTDNGPQFSSESFNQWLASIGSHHVFSPPRHPQSNGLAENFVKTLKTAIKATAPSNFEQLESITDNFLLQYRNAKHHTTGKTPAFLFKGRNLRSALNFDTTETSFLRGNDGRVSQGVILRPIGKSLVEIIDTSDSSIHRRHIDQCHISPSKECNLSLPNAESTPIPPINIDSLQLPSTDQSTVIAQDYSSKMIEQNKTLTPTNTDADTQKHPHVMSSPTQHQSPVQLRRSSRQSRPPAFYKDYTT